MRWSALVAIVLAAMTTLAAQQNWLAADFHTEARHVSESCNNGFKSAMGCAIEFFTDHPLHIAVGSLPPQNGFGVGGAFGEWRDTTNWRLSWDVDAVGTTSGAWRAGGYMKMVHTGNGAIHVPKPVIPQPGEKPKPKKPPVNFVHPFTAINLYTQAISLNKLNYFGLGNDTPLTGASVFGMTQTIVGANVIKPVFEWPAVSKLNLALLGEINGRFVDIRGESGQSVPTIYALYSDTTAPGLSSQPGFAQFGEGFRISPVIADRLQLSYLANIQEFETPSDSGNSFQRWTVDLNHTFYLYGYTKSGPAVNNGDANGPDSCAHGDEKCPGVAHSWNRNGFVTARLLLSESMNAASHVPFYFQQTLGGGDINGDQSLGSYQDYRFRAPNLLLLQGSVEHSVWGPFGLKFMADQGRVALTRSDVGFSHLRHSFAAGLTLRAGGFPMVSMMFAWGGPEGHHNIFNMNSSLLGGSARPTLD